MSSFFYYFLLILMLPVFIIYLILAFTLPVVRFGKVKRGGTIRCRLYKDAVHSDYIFESDLWAGIFKPKGKFVKIGWGDRKIFLETRSWGELKPENLIKAFLGLNKTTLRVDFMDSTEDLYFIDMTFEQFEKIVAHVKKSTNMVPVEKLPEYYQQGDFYESDLSYNCLTNCNNWVNLGLRSAGISNRLWCPLTLWLD
jgi:uncharacterized protein (TIGR02117 family)